jgi:hypothetical protein
MVGSNVILMVLFMRIWSKELPGWYSGTLQAHSEEEGSYGTAMASMP